MLFVYFVWFPVLLLGIKSANSSPPNSNGINPLRMGEAMYGGPALFAEDVNSLHAPQFSVGKSITKVLQTFGKVASFHPGEDILPLQDLRMTGGNVGPVLDESPYNSVNNTADSSSGGMGANKSPENTKKLRRGVSRVGSFDSELQQPREGRTQIKST
jgi:hypothetical protein